MHVIPVIDLLNGEVVHAKHGNREAYSPIQSSLTKAQNPIEIIEAFLDIYAFDTLYIADLNAIQGLPENNHQAIINRISNTFSHIDIWLDSGLNHPSQLANSTLNPLVKPVLGSESFKTLDEFLLLSNAIDKGYILSLDFMPNGYKGPIELLSSNQYWPQKTIVMSLAHVGVNNGFNADIYNEINMLKTDHDLYIAGGIRHVNDLFDAKAKGANGALVASALHNKHIQAQDLINLQQ